MKDVLVLEASEGIAGPICGLQLADLGARVIKLEPLAGDRTRSWGPPFVDGDAAPFLGLNRNKEGLALDHGHPAAREVLVRLLARADVLIEHPRRETPCLAEALGREPTHINPRLVHLRISANGTAGPLSGSAGSELTAQALSGYWRLAGTPKDPPLRFGAEIAEVGTGLFGFQAAMAGLLSRERTGEGQAVDLSLLATLMSFGTILTSAMHNPDDWLGFHLMNIVWPPDTGYHTADQKVTLEFRRGQKLWAAFCRQVGLGHLVDDPRFADWRSTIYTGDRVGETKADYEAGLSTLPSSIVMGIATDVGGTSVPHNAAAAVTAHPQIESVGVLTSMPLPSGGSMRQVGTPFRAKTPEAPPPHRPPPRLGQHTRAILEEVGFADREIGDLLRSGAAAVITSHGANANRLGGN